jgi:hypothetical protein
MDANRILKLAGLTESQETISLDTVRDTLSSTYDEKEDGPVMWQVFGTTNFVGLGFDLTYRRMTPATAWTKFSARVEAANAVLKRVAEKYKTQFKVEINLSTKPTRGEYSEYEQEFVGEIRIFNKEK